MRREESAAGGSELVPGVGGVLSSCGGDGQGLLRRNSWAGAGENHSAMGWDPGLMRETGWVTRGTPGLRWGTAGLRWGTAVLRWGNSWAQVGEQLG